MSLNELIIYIFFVIGFAVSPGPNQMLYLMYTFEYGRKAGWATAAGIVSSFVIHIIAIIMGLTAILLSMPLALNIVRYFGIGYLFYLAIRNVKISQWKKSTDSNRAESLSPFYFKGFIGNLLNPGSFVLYFSLIPQFIHPDRGNFLRQILLLASFQMLFSFITNCTIIFFAGYATNTFFKNVKYEKRIRYAMSIFIIVFAFKLLY